MRRSCIESGVAEVVLLNVQPPLEHSRASAFIAGIARAGIAGW
jgi:hypothetical protein